MKNQFVYSVILVIIIFIFSRLPYYLYYSVTVISFDTASYCVVALNIMEGNLPLFDIRTPGYPVFLYIVWLFSKNPIYISLVQSLFTLFTSIFFLWVINKTFKSFTILFATSILIFISSSVYILFETAISSESLYVSFLILTCSFLILALKENKLLHWILFSISIAMVILIRPAGMFLLSVMFFLLIFFIVNKYKIKFYGSLIIPFLIVVFSLCTYNYFILKSFTISPLGEISLSGATVLYMEPSAEYPEFVNNAINKTLNKTSQKDITYVKNNLGMSKLYKVFQDNFWNGVTLINFLIKGDSNLKYIDIQPIIRKISIDAIKKYPLVYGKFVLCNFYQFFMNIRNTFDLYTVYADAYKGTIIQRKHLNILYTGEWSQVTTNKGDNEKVIDFYLEEINGRTNLENVVVIDSNKVELKPSLLKSTFQTYEKIHNLLFRNIIWLILFAIVFSISIFKLIKSKFSNVDSFIFFLLGTMFISNALLISIVQSALDRYTYTTEFVMYLSLPFLFIFLRNKLGKKRVRYKIEPVPETSVV